MKKVIIDNNEFDYEIGIRVLKMKFPECPPQLVGKIGDIWDSIKPLTFKEIATKIVNVEQRRIAILYLGLEKMTEEVKPTLIGMNSIKKESIWINAKGEMENVPYDDVYELFEVDGKRLFDGADVPKWRQDRITNVYFVRCKDASTDRMYHLWVDINSVANTNGIQTWRNEGWEKRITAIMAIAWTITTNVKEGSIEKIIRQGDCILVKKKPNAVVGEFRHLTEKEYKTLLVNES